LLSVAAYNRRVRPDELLLVAAFRDGQPGAAAWREWSRGRDLAALDPAEMRLLPAVYRTLRDDAPPIVKQMARSMFIRTRLLLREVGPVIALLRAQGIESLLLKGAALVAAGYVDAGARPMSDFDLLVHPHDAERAAALLEQAGWRRTSNLMIAFQHAAVFRRGEAGCDLHWWSLWDSRDAAADARVWEGGEEATLHGVALRVPRPEHLLLHAIVHGTRAFDLAAVRWIGDALAILRARPLDWDLFVREASARGVAWPAGEALAYLAETFGASVPATAIAALQSRRVSRRQRRLYAPRGRRTNTSVMFLGALLDVWLRERTSLRARLLWLPRNLQYILRTKSLLRLPMALVRKGVQVFTSKS
jgi:Uncharacterised nucleotidyltransferase